jgi:hypothetical protein
MLLNNAVTDWLSCKYDHSLFLHLLLSYGLDVTFALMHPYLTTPNSLATGILIQALIRLGGSLMSACTVVTLAPCNSISVKC